MKVQALDSETKHWILAKITETNQDESKSKVTWVGYKKCYDRWLSNNEIRIPIEARPMRSRNAISVQNFPTRKHPKNLLLDDVVYDTKRQCSFKVASNDQYKALVSLKNILTYPF